MLTRLCGIWFVIFSPHTQFLYICHMEKSEIPPHVEEFHIQIFENTLHNVCVCQHVTQWILNSPKYKIPKHAYLSDILRKPSYADVKRSSGVREFSIRKVIFGETMTLAKALICSLFTTHLANAAIINAYGWLLVEWIYLNFELVYFKFD